MKFLFVQNNADMYGSSRSMLRLSTRLIRDGHHVCAVLPYEGPLREALSGAGVLVELMPGLSVVNNQILKTPRALISFLFGCPVSTWKMIGLIRRWNPDVVHTNTSVALTPGVAARLMRVPHVWHIRENYSEFRSFWKVYQHYMGMFSDAIICVSKSIQDQFCLSLQNKKTHVINNGFPKDEFPAVEPDRIHSFRETFGLGDASLVGLIGRINIQRKGQNVFVDAVARLKKACPDVTFLIIGDVFPGNEWQRDALRDQMQSLGVEDRFVLTGDVEDVKAVYAALDLVLMVSELPEAFSGVVIEGMAMGKPVIGTDAGGTAEQIVNGETGLLIPPADPDALAEALDCLLSDRDAAERMGKTGRARFEAEFEFTPFYQRIMGVYRSLTRTEVV